MRNTKVELGLEIRNMHLNNFLLTLKNSGYKTKFRIEILNRAVKAFDKMLEDDRKGINPLKRVNLCSTNTWWNISKVATKKRGRAKQV